MTNGSVCRIKNLAVNKGKVPVLSLSCTKEIACEFSLSQREVELLALENGICPSRYERSIGTFGFDGQAGLLRASAAVVGCGGLGGWIIEILARAGVGRIVMADGDVFDENNLNRQLFASESDIGRSKSECAARRVREINSSVTPVPYNVIADSANGLEMFKGCSVVVDALDSNSARKAVFAVCRELDIPFVHGAIAGYYGQAAVFRKGDSPLWENEGVSDRGIETETGNPPFTPPFIASVEAAEALKILAGLSGVLSGELLWFDLARHDLQKIKL